MPFGTTGFRHSLAYEGFGAARASNRVFNVHRSLGAEIVELCLEDIDWRAGTLIVRDERLGANIKLQLDIVSFFDIDFERPAEVLAHQCAGYASRLDRRRDIDS